jgi:hypothetical protein
MRPAKVRENLQEALVVDFMLQEPKFDIATGHEDCRNLRLGHDAFSVVATIATEFRA